jgi:hypothetical protein
MVSIQGGDAAADDIAGTDQVQWANEQQREFSFWLEPMSR